MDIFPQKIGTGPKSIIYKKHRLQAKHFCKKRHLSPGAQQAKKAYFKNYYLALFFDDLL
jgi:hypothetical protein